MKAEVSEKNSSSNRIKAEFDSLADEYHEVHQTNVAITGEKPEYFSEYKIADLANLVNKLHLPSSSILDFGSGIGNSVPFFRKYFPNAQLTCADVSARSIEVAQTRFPGKENYVLVDDGVPVPTASQDVVFTACVFHHIPHEEHQKWLNELRRITKPNGLLVIFEHNPLNPLTVHAVNTCPLDVNARLIRGGGMKNRALKAGWSQAEVGYKLFFPAVFAKFRFFEQYLEWLALGAQYRVLARNTKD